jgi:hypothetical protein
MTALIEQLVPRASRLLCAQAGTMLRPGAIGLASGPLCGLAHSERVCRRP